MTIKSRKVRNALKIARFIFWMTAAVLALPATTALFYALGCR